MNELQSPLPGAPNAPVGVAQKLRAEKLQAANAEIPDLFYFWPESIGRLVFSPSI